MSTRSRRIAFSLVELLVAIGIIALLLALLLPALSRARHAGRSAKCLANLQQWTAAYQMYVNANHGRSIVFGPVPVRMDNGSPAFWWELLEPFYIRNASALLCPEATDLDYGDEGHSAFAAWQVRLWDAPDKMRGTFVGSIGINGWLYVNADEAERTALSSVTIRLPATESSRVPVFFDSARWDTWPRDTEEPRIYVPLMLGRGAMQMVLVRRHGQGLNVAYLDGHAERATLEELWKMKWSENFVAKEVQVKE